MGGTGGAFEADDELDSRMEPFRRCAAVGRYLETRILGLGGDNEGLSREATASLRNC